jgi:hypothetical protein
MYALACFSSSRLSGQRTTATPRSVPEAAQKEAFDWKPIPLVKCWMAELDDEGNEIKPAGCEGVSIAQTGATSTLASRAGTAGSVAGTEVMSCLRDFGAVLCVAGDDQQVFDATESASQLLLLRDQ